MNLILIQLKFTKGIKYWAEIDAVIKIVLGIKTEQLKFSYNFCLYCREKIIQIYAKK